MQHHHIFIKIWKSSKNDVEGKKITNQKWEIAEIQWMLSGREKTEFALFKAFLTSIWDTVHDHELPYVFMLLYQL